jgi:CRISPR-associated protein Cmr4
MKTKLLFIQSLSPLHAGTGQGVGVIDQPIAREKATNIPYLPGSSIKGVFRDACAGLNCDVEAIFGPATDNADAFAGSVTISDARLLLLPVRSLSGVFAWVTSPFILQRFKRDLEASVPDDAKNLTIPTVPAESCLVCEDGTELFIQTGDSQVVLEDLKLAAQASTALADWAAWLGEKIFPDDPYWQGALKKRLCLVPDDVLSFLLEIGTEVTARIRIKDDSKTVIDGALWYEEALPTETILSSLVVASNVRAKPHEVFDALDQISKQTIQFGGSATVGRGLCQIQLVSKEA